MNFIARSPSSYRKFFGNANCRLDLVTLENQEKMYQARYADLSWSRFLFTAFKRLLSPIGLSETLLAAYLASPNISLRA